MLENAPYDFSRPVVEGLTLTARWTAARSISYVLDGGVNAPGNPDWYLPGEGVPQLGAPTRDMADFSGWYRDAAFTQGPVTSIGPAEDGDITLFAKWTLRSTAITPVGPKPAEPLPDDPQPPFTDISAGSWCEDAVAWAAEKGIAQGVGGGLFGPELPCTRGQIVTFLWRAAGSPQPAALRAFTDVPADSYCAKAVAWAVEKGITTGTGDGRFSPDAPCTRAQAAVFLYRWEQSRGDGFTGAWMFRLPFADVPEWAYEAIAWCSMKGITQGTGETTFSPDLPCTRGQILTFLYRMENPGK